MGMKTRIIVASSANWGVFMVISISWVRTRIKRKTGAMFAKYMDFKMLRRLWLNTVVIHVALVTATVIGPGFSLGVKSWLCVMLLGR